MSNITTRSAKGSALTHAEMDANWTRTVSQKTTTYQILAADNRSVIECNSATPFTVTLPAVATAAGEDTGDFECTVTNINTGAVTVDGSGAETIDGAANVVLEQWDSVTVKLDSADAAWKIISLKGSDQTVQDLTVEGAFTSLGIDDNATGERVEINDTTIDIGPNTSAANYSVRRAVDDGSLIITGGSGAATGGSIEFYGGSHSTAAGDILFQSDNQTWGRWDESAGEYILSTGTGAKTTAITVNNVQDVDCVGNITALTVNADGDTSAGDNCALGYTATEGAILTGQGSTNDVTIKNDADTAVIEIPTGTTNVTVAGTLNGLNLGVAQAANHIRAGNIQLLNGSTTPAAFDFVTDVTESSFETVGPTGSGATNIWTALDAIDSTATIAIVQLIIGGTSSLSSIGSLTIYATAGAAEEPTPTASSSTAIGQIRSRSDGTTTQPDGEMIQVMIPLDSNQTFQITWDQVNMTSLTGELHYRGFITD